jgi:hypothetical protein
VEFSSRLVVILQKCDVFLRQDSTDIVPQVKEAVGTSAGDLPRQATGTISA